MKQSEHNRHPKSPTTPKSEGPEKYLSDWLIPFCYNFWLQFGVFLFVAGWILLFVPVYFAGFLGLKLVGLLGFIGALCVAIGIVVAGTTLFGKETTRAFRDVRRQLKNRKNKTRKLPEMEAILSVHHTYCAKAGVKAAAVKGRVAHELPPKFPKIFSFVNRRPRNFQKWLGRNPR